MKANSDLVVLQDGTYADPKDISKGKDGVMRHKNGMGVALGENGQPLTLGDVAAMNADAASASKGG